MTLFSPFNVLLLCLSLIPFSFSLKMKSFYSFVICSRFFFILFTLLSFYGMKNGKRKQFHITWYWLERIKCLWCELFSLLNLIDQRQLSFFLREIISILMIRRFSFIENIHNASCYFVFLSFSEHKRKSFFSSNAKKSAKMREKKVWQVEFI